MPLAPRDVWKMLHLLYRAGGAGVPTRVIETAGFGCGPDAARILADGDAVLVDASGPAERLVLSKAAHHILSHCTVANGSEGGVVEVDRPRAFVVMPFGEAWSDRVLHELIGGALEDAATLTGRKFGCTRGDDVVRVGNLKANVWFEILRAGFVIADLSAPNPNVYYELGLADALGKDTFVLKQKGVTLPADFGGAHYTEYDLGNLAAARMALAPVRSAAGRPWSRRGASKTLYT